MLQKSECERLRAHFGPAFLSKALYDVAVYRDKSKAAELVGDRLTRNERRRAKKKEGQEEDVGYIRALWTSLMQTLRASFKKIVTFLKKNVTWRHFVDAGVFPSAFDAIYTSVNSMASRTGAAFVAAFSALGSELSNIWAFVKKLFASTNDEDDSAVVVAEMEEETSTFARYMTNLSDFVLSYIEPIGRKIAGGFMSLLEAVRKAVFGSVRMASTAATMLLEVAHEKSDAARRLLFGVFCGILDLGVTTEKEFIKPRLDVVFKFFNDELVDMLPLLSSWVDQSSVEQTVMWKTGAFVGATVGWLIQAVKWLSSTLKGVAVGAVAWLTSFMPAITGLFSSLCGDYLQSYVEEEQKDGRFEENVAGLETVLMESKSRLSSETRKSIESTLECVDSVMQGHERLRAALERRDPNLALRAEVLVVLSRGGTPTSDQLDALVRTQTGYRDAKSFAYVGAGLEQLVASELLVAREEAGPDFDSLGVEIGELEHEKALLLRKREAVQIRLYRGEASQDDLDDLDRRMFKLDREIASRKFGTKLWSRTLGLLALGVSGVAFWSYYGDLVAYAAKVVWQGPPPDPPTWSDWALAPWNWVTGYVPLENVNIISAGRDLLNFRWVTGGKKAAALAFGAGASVSVLYNVWKFVYAQIFSLVGYVRGDGAEYAESEWEKLPSVEDMAKALLTMSKQAYDRSELAHNQRLKTVGGVVRAGGALVGTFNPVLGGAMAAGGGALQSFASGPKDMEETEEVKTIEAKRVDLKKNGPAVRKALPATVPRIEDVTEKEEQKVVKSKKKQQKQQLVVVEDAKARVRRRVREKEAQLEAKKKSDDDNRSWGF